jgi:NADH:ubiquinone oxidoreductase subunit F (NADH-binding)/NADH:ubiquinone oxidoreductase subunit E
MTNIKNVFTPIDPEISALAEEHSHDPDSILEIFKQIQERRGYLSREAITDVARSLHIPVERAYGVASFYTMLALEPQKGHVARVCDGPVCWLHRATEVRKAADELFEGSSGWTVERNSCLGLCDRAPAALVDGRQVGPLTPDRVREIPSGWQGEPVDYSQARPGERRIMMAKAGLIDPGSIESALEQGAYRSLKAILSRTPQSVIDDVEASGHNGRGGAGFPVGRKWRFVAGAQEIPKYVICNADEAEPLLFKDRVLIETNPHQVLEGMAIAGYATGASQAYIYIRGEYEPQARLLEQAIMQAEEHGWLGDDIQESGFSFHVHVHRGAGAYICGEETALIESLEGKRGEPRSRPPYPPSFGYRGKPTLVNNVESMAAVPAIIANGAEWYQSLSPEGVSAGTKMFIILGHVNNPGLFEAPFGLTLRQIIDDFGGGMRPGSQFQFALTGGAAGTIVSSEFLDIPIDYKSAAKGISLGAGAFLVCDQSVSPVRFLREIMHFFAKESCGKCTPCRQGTNRSLEILNRMAEGGAQRGDLEELRNLANVMQIGSFCGLGQSVNLPVNSALRNLPEAFETAVGS